LKITSYTLNCTPSLSPMPMAGGVPSQTRRSAVSRHRHRGRGQRQSRGRPHTARRSYRAQPSPHHAATTAWRRRSSRVRRPKELLLTLPYPVLPVQHPCKARSGVPTHICAALRLAAGCCGGLQRAARAMRHGVAADGGCWG